MIQSIKTQLREKKDQLTTDAFALAAALVVVALPFSIKLTTQAIILFAAAWLFQNNFSRLGRVLKKSATFWLLTSLYLLTVLSLFYTQNLAAGLWELEKGATLLLFPLMMASAKKLAKSRIDFILKAFVLANLTFGIISVAYATYKYFAENINIFFYHDLVSPLFNSHATYYSMYLIFSLFILFYFYGQKEKPSWQLKVLTGGITVFFTLLIYLLAIRSIIIFFTFTALMAIVFYIFKTRNIILGIAMLGGFLMLMFFAVKENEVLKEKVFQIFENYEYELSKDHIEGYNGLTTRLAQWESSLPIIKKNPVLGVGPGDVQDELQIVYKENYLVYSFRSRFNAHSQYFQTCLGLGILGLTLLLASLVIPSLLAYRRKNMLYLCFLVLFGFCCITESMLYVQKGIVFYSFFSSLFVFQMLNQSDEDKQTERKGN